MNMRAAGPGGMAEVVERRCFAENRRPWHFVQVVVQRHRVRDERKTIVQTAVRLDVQIFRVSIGDIQQFFGVIAVGTAAVDLKLNAKMPKPFAMENEVGRIAVLMND